MNENKTETNAAHAFVRTAGGYCPEEVDAYIYRITENYADLYRENIILNYQLEELKEQLSAMQRHENIHCVAEALKKNDALPSIRSETIVFRPPTAQGDIPKKKRRRIPSVADLLAEYDNTNE